MKKHRSILALATLAVTIALALALAPPTPASVQYLAQEKLYFNKANGSGALVDSQTVSIVNMTTSTTVAAASDTTKIANLSKFKFDGGTSAATTQVPRVALMITQAGASTDSAAYIVQWSADPTFAKFTTASTGYITAPTAYVTILDSDDALGPYYRVIIWGNDTGAVVRSYTVTPLVIGEQ